MKRMNKKQWYESLEKYSLLAAQRKNVIEEYGILYWDKEKELTQIQDALLQQRRIVRDIIASDATLWWQFENRIDIIFDLVENLEPVPEEVYRNSFVKPDFAVPMFVILVGMVLLLLYRLGW